eukprot:m51a1_g11338 hypothetical protein (432) ;mRNA; f:150861-152156
MVGVEQSARNVSRSDDSAAPGPSGDAAGSLSRVVGGSAEVLAQATHERLGECSPVAMLSGQMLRDLCRTTAETLLVFDTPSSVNASSRSVANNSDSGTSTSQNSQAPGSSATAPVFTRTWGAPDRWLWRTGPAHSGISTAAVVEGSAAAQWGPGRVLVCGGTTSESSGARSLGDAPSRIFDVAQAEWLSCAVPAPHVTDHVAVSHRGTYYAVSGLSTAADDDSDEERNSCAVHVRALADDGSAWSDRRYGDFSALVCTASSAAGSLWALVYECGHYGCCSCPLHLARCDPRESGWEEIPMSGFRSSGAVGVSMAACGDFLCAVGGIVVGSQGPFCFTPTTGERRCQRLDVRKAGGSWQDMAPLNEGRGRCGLVALEDRQCLVAIGGMTSGAGAVQSVELYSPVVDKWFQVPELPVPCQCAHQTAVALRTFM